MLERDPKRRLKVGLFSVAVLALLAAAILAIGSKQGLFVRHNDYVTRFTDVGGLVAGAPVRLNGVVVGSVISVGLPANPAEEKITVEFSVETRLEKRLREDSRVRIGTLGLLGDRYLEVSSGSPSSPQLPPGAVVKAEESRELSQVIATSGDVMTNVLGISASLRRILERVERGEGILGELTVSPETGPHVMERLDSVLEQADALLRDVRAGRGLLGRLVTPNEGDERMVADFQAFVAAGREATEAMASDLKRNDSMLAAILRDPEGKAKVEAFVDHLGTAAAGLSVAATDLANEKGVLGRLIGDEAFAGDFLTNLNGLTLSLRGIADKVNRGEGTAGKLITDPGLFDDMQDVVRGVKHSKILTWLIRNRREAGEKAAAEAARAEGGSK